MKYEHNEKQDLRVIADCGWYDAGRGGRRRNRVGILGFLCGTIILRKGELDLLKGMGPNKGPSLFIFREKYKLLYGKVAQTGEHQV